MKSRIKYILSLLFLILFLYSLSYSLSTFKNYLRVSSGGPLNKALRRAAHPRYLKEKCDAGKIYTIRSTEDLFTHRLDLQCIFFAAETPQKIFEGGLLGEVFYLINLNLFNPLIREIWKGKHISKTECQGEPTYLGWNSLFGAPAAPFITQIGRMSEGMNAHPLYLDNKTSIILNYTAEAAIVCPDWSQEGSILRRIQNNLTVQRSPWYKSFFPLNAFIDLVRPVGKQQDGGIIYLGQAFLIDIFRSDHQAFPIAFFSLLNYDPDVVPQMEVEQALKPLTKDLYYRNNNVLDVLGALLPLDNLLTEPFHAGKTLLKEIPNSVPKLWNFIKDFISGLGSEDSLALVDVLERLKELNKQDDEGKDGLIKYHSKSPHSHFNEL